VAAKIEAILASGEPKSYFLKVTHGDGSMAANDYLSRHRRCLQLPSVQNTTKDEPCYRASLIP
jgi:hypothetical protein